MTRPTGTKSGRPGHSQYTDYMRARQNQALVRRDRLARDVPRAVLRAALVGLGLGLVIAFGLGLPGMAVLVFVALVTVWPAAVAVAAFGASPEVETLRETAEAERKTAHAIARLRRHGYVVLHDRAVPYSEATIGHLLIGPGGVMVVGSDINKGIVRYSKGDAVCDGESLKPPIERVAWLGGEVRGQLRSAVPGVKIPVRPILAMVHADVLWSDGAVDGVTIISIKDVVNYVRHKAGQLNPGQVRQVLAAAERLFPPYSANRLAEQITVDRDQWLTLMDALRTIRERDGDASAILDRLAQIEADLGRQADLINRAGMPLARAGEMPTIERAEGDAGQADTDGPDRPGGVARGSGSGRLGSHRAPHHGRILAAVRTPRDDRPAPAPARPAGTAPPDAGRLDAAGLDAAGLDAAGLDDGRPISSVRPDGPDGPAGTTGPAGQAKKRSPSAGRGDGADADDPHLPRPGV